MFKHKLLFLSFLLIALVFILHSLGTKFFLYWTISWYDIPMHVLGGFWVALTILWILFKFDYFDSMKHYRMKIFLIVIISTLIVSVLWEVFELTSKITSLSDGRLYWVDTIKDLIDDTLGGFLAYFFFTKRTSSPKEVFDGLEIDKAKK